jgi:hypothetical protein
MSVTIFTLSGSKTGQLKIKSMPNRFEYLNLKESLERIQFLEWQFPACFFIFENINLENIIKCLASISVSYQIRFETYMPLKEPAIIKKPKTKDFSKGDWQSKENCVKISEIDDDIFEVDFKYDATILELIKSISDDFREYDRITKKWKISGAMHVEKFIQDLKSKSINIKI